MRIADAAGVRETQNRLPGTEDRLFSETERTERDGCKECPDGVDLRVSAQGLALWEQQRADIPKAESPVQEYGISEAALKQMYQEQAESAKQAGDGIEDMSKMMEIARRIARGDKVPGTDERKLMEYNADLYQAAKAAAILNADRKHKKYKSLFRDEENEDTRLKLRELEQDGHTGDAVTENTEPEGAPSENIQISEE